MNLEPNEKLFPDHFSSIIHGASVGAVSIWPSKPIYQTRQHRDMTTYVGGDYQHTLMF